MSTNVFYECHRCGASMSEYELEQRGGSVKCISCGFRVLKKMKPPVVKRVNSR